ncbi:MAG: hypothetical protein JJU12_04765 [Chlamydiales bacterium]|nr:hypothetical protein [Chlamydiales bacterium]
MVNPTPKISVSSSIYPWNERPVVEDKTAQTERFPIYQMGKKQFKEEMALLDLFFKKTFAVTDANLLQQYLRSEKEILPPYYPLFDAYSNWLIDEILTPSDPRERGLVIKRAIKLAQFFYLSGNFQAYFMTLSALQQDSISRLEKSWTFLPKKFETWMLSEIKVCFTGNHSYLQKAMESYDSPFFPHLLAYKKEYQKILALYHDKSLALETHPDLQRELTHLSKRMQEISFQISKLHNLLMNTVREKPLPPSIFVSGVQKWEGYHNPNLEENFLNRSKLLE